MKKIFLLLIIALCLCGCGNKNPQESGGQQAMPTTAGYSNEKICWGFKKVKGSVPQIPESTASLLKRYNGFFVGDTTKKEIYLTFDEGYENGYTEKILDTLKKTNTPAAFFITGQFIKENADLVKRMASEGHIVGNHSLNHPSFPDVDDERLKKELDSLNQMYINLTGKSMVYLRPPKGEFSERTLALCQKLGYKSIFWSSAYVDWDVNRQSGVKNAVSKVTSQLHNGNIILLHAVSKDNAEGLESIINEARAMGYTFKTLDNL